MGLGVSVHHLLHTFGLSPLWLGHRNQLINKLQFVVEPRRNIVQTGGKSLAGC